MEIYGTGDQQLYILTIVMSSYYYFMEIYLTGDHQLYIIIDNSDVIYFMDVFSQLLSLCSNV